MTIIYPGSFDPLTKGHLDIIRRGAEMADHLIVGVLVNANKKPMFTLEQRVEIIRSEVDAIPNVEVVPFTGLLVDFLKKMNCRYVIRGLRAVSDFEYELQMAQANKNLYPEMESIFLSTSVEYSFVSSTVVKDILKYGGDASHLVPENAMKIIHTIVGGNDNGSGSSGNN